MSEKLTKVDKVIDKIYFLWKGGGGGGVREVGGPGQ